ncbi:RTA1 like protein-domain-containing protein [Hypoxylon cercidicola]|nr:RTA1 like protein-domain-containing protein [Hypoxylon cercidicola]
MASFADCTLDRCSQPFLEDEPSLVGNAIFIALFAVLIPLTLGLGLKYKSSVFATIITTGLALEVLGYVGRVLLRNNPTGRTDFILFLVGTILGPAFICVAIFLTMPCIVTVYGDDFRSWKPVWYQLLLYALTAASAVLELAGVLVSMMQDTQAKADAGVHILTAGLAVQLVSLAIFVGHAVLFVIAVRTRHHALDIEFAGIYNSTSFKAFLFAFSLATVLLVLRTAFRIVVIAEGYDSSIAQSETLLFVLDGLMVLLATIILLGFFPGRMLGQSWPQTSSRRVSRTLPQQIQVPPYELPSTRSSPTYNRISTKYPLVNYSPKKSNYTESLPQRNLVDHEALW